MILFDSEKKTPPFCWLSHHSLCGKKPSSSFGFVHGKNPDTPEKNIIDCRCSGENDDEPLDF
jgi:hypothetical protein